MINQNNIDTFKDKKVLLVGDTIVDVYTYCNTVCEALYAPIREVEEIRSAISFGGNSLVASNILELGGNVTFISVVGDDAAAKYYDSFTHPQLKKIFFTDKTRKTTVKERWFAEGKALLQVNRVDNHDLSVALEKKVCEAIEEEVKDVDVIVVMDPQHGFLTKNVISKILSLSKKCEIPLYVDVQISHRESKHTLYRGADTFFLNSNEVKAVHQEFSAVTALRSLKEIAQKLEAENIIVKLGKRGSVAWFNGTYIKTDAHPVVAVDPCGAGDAFLAAFSLCNRITPEDALTIANIWGGLSTTIHGTIPPKKKDLKKQLSA